MSLKIDTNAKTNATQNNPKVQAKKEGKYYVSRGETLSSIAKKFNMTVEDFKKFAKLKSNSLSAGQLLNVPHVKVKSGDSLYNIAKQNGMTVTELKKINGMNSNSIDVGDVLYIYGKTEQTQKPATVEKKTVTAKQTPEVKQETKPEIKSNVKPESNTSKKSVTLNNGKTHTLDHLQESAIKSGKNDAAFKNIENPYIVRPKPYVVNGKIEAKCEVQNPTSKNGTLKGKVVILNPGHGGYQQDDGSFDPGAVYNVNGKPMEEWKVCQDNIAILASKLRSKGATVVIVQGAVQQGGMFKQKYLENLVEGKKGSNEVRNLMKNTPKSDMLFLSVHIESAKTKPDQKQCSVIAKDQKDIELAKNIKLSLKDGFAPYEPTINTERSLYVNNAMGKEITSCLLEIGNIANKDIQKSLESKHDMNKYMECISDAIEKTIGKEEDTWGFSNSLSDFFSKNTRDRYIKVTENPTYLVKSGDNYSTIAKKHGTTLNYLLEINDLKGNETLNVGDLLKIPPKREVKNINSLDDIPKAMGVSKDFIKGLKRIEDGYKDNGKPYGDNEFHNEVYTDDAGNKTIGIGHLAEKGQTHLKDKEVLETFAKDLLKMEENLWAKLGKENFEKLPQGIKEALLDMTFNKGSVIITEQMVNDLKNGKYESAINQMTHNKTAKGVELSGLNKRRLFDVATAIKIYDGKKVPQSNIETIKKLYSRGLELLKAECKNSGTNFENISKGYKDDIKSYFKDIISPTIFS